MDSETIIGLVALAGGMATLILLGAAEAGVIAGVRERALREPTESPFGALQRFYQERQLTVSSLALARNLVSVAITAISVFLVLKHTEDNWGWLFLTIAGVALAFMLLQALPRLVVAQDPSGWHNSLRPFVSNTVPVPPAGAGARRADGRRYADVAAAPAGRGRRRRRADAAFGGRRDRSGTSGR